MATPLLQAKNLSVAFGDNVVVDRVSFSLQKGKMLALVGESGSGKSMSALSIPRLLPDTAHHPSGEILYRGTDLLQATERDLRNLRGNAISMIFQEPMTSLNPLHTLEKQLKEALLIHQPLLASSKVKARIKELLELVELDQLKTRLHAYPHELSGGQRQRIMIAMALANNPDILIADEPTTALDVTVQATILKLIKNLQQELGMAVLLITHDLTVVRNIADTIAVMQAGKLVETGTVAKVYDAPKHSYTRRLLNSIPKGTPARTANNAPILLESKRLKVYFPIKQGVFGKTVNYVKAVDNVSVNVKQGRTLGIVGESGSGKTTLAFALLRLIASEGTITFNNARIDTCNTKALRHLRQELQIVFQDPFTSLNPRMSIGQIINEGLHAHELYSNPDARETHIAKTLSDVGLDPAMAGRYPHQFSGGQRQRIGIARALALGPKLIALDEPTSALDVSTQSEILTMLKELQQQKQLSYLFISHDLRVIKAISHDIIVMRHGKIVEHGTRAEIFNRPKHDYTKRLIDAAFKVK